MSGEEEEKETLKCLVAIETKVDNLVKSSQRTIYALIGVIGATVGVKLMNSPVISIIFTYVSLFAGLFALSSTIWEWRRINKRQKALRLSFVTLLLFSVTSRTFIFESGISAAPVWYSPCVDVLFIIISVFLVLGLIRPKVKLGKGNKTEGNPCSAEANDGQQVRISE